MQQRVLDSDIRVSWDRSTQGRCSRPGRPAVAPGAEAVGSPIPGTQKAEAIGGKLGRADIELSIAELTEIEAGAAQIQPRRALQEAAEAMTNL